LLASPLLSFLCSSLSLFLSPLLSVSGYTTTQDTGPAVSIVFAADVPDLSS
jgi:hypothetical protein